MGPGSDHNLNCLTKESAVLVRPSCDNPHPVSIKGDGVSSVGFIWAVRRYQTCVQISDIDRGQHTGRRRSARHEHNQCLPSRASHQDCLHFTKISSIIEIDGPHSWPVSLSKTVGVTMSRLTLKLEPKTIHTYASAFGQAHATCFLYARMWRRWWKGRILGTDYIKSSVPMAPYWTWPRDRASALVPLRMIYRRQPLSTTSGAYDLALLVSSS